VSGESIREEMRTVAAAAEKKRELMKALIATPGSRQPDGSLLVSPLEWQDSKAAEIFGIEAADIAAMRKELGITVQNVTVAIEAAAARLDSLVNTKEGLAARADLLLDAGVAISAYGETEHHGQERLAARNLLELMKLGMFIRRS
jgi:hypothetical protein